MGSPGRADPNTVIKLYGFDTHQQRSSLCVAAKMPRKLPRVSLVGNVMIYGIMRRDTTLKAGLLSSTVSRLPFLSSYLYYDPICISDYADSHRRQIRSLQLRRNLLAMPESHINQTACLYRAARSKVNHKISWEGVWAQNVGVVLTTISFSALSYGGMKR